MRWIALLLSICLVSPFSLDAQSSVTDWQRLAVLASGDPILVKTKPGAKYHARFIQDRPDALVIEVDERAFPGRRQVRRELVRADVAEVRRYSPGKSTLVGVGIGAAVGAGIGTAIDNSAKSNEDGRLGTVVFVLLGTLLGLIVGRHTALVKGEVIYRAQ
ncbi:MAG: hypothetical protein ABI824_17530 [Acidobacteriota bacterium]